MKFSSRQVARALGEPDIAILWSSRYDQWRTPDWLFDRLNAEFAFGLDAAAVDWNARCREYLTPDEDALTIPDWRPYSEARRAVYINPPYSRVVGRWVRKAAEQSRLGLVVVMLILARTDTAWFHDIIWKQASEVRIVRGRVRFGHETKTVDNTCPAPSIVVVFRPSRTGPPVVTTLEP